MTVSVAFSLEFGSLQQRYQIREEQPRWGNILKFGVRGAQKTLAAFGTKYSYYNR